MALEHKPFPDHISEEELGKFYIFLHVFYHPKDHCVICVALHNEVSVPCV